MIEHLRYDSVDLIGSSGGALVAINVALERPDLVGKVVADSFEGEAPLEEFVANAEEERRISKEDADTRAFYEFNHGEGWKSVVDNATHMPSLNTPTAWDVSFTGRLRRNARS